MNKKGIENLTLAVACELNDFKIIETILNDIDFIQPFISWRTKKLSLLEDNNKCDTGVYDDLFNYMAQTLPTTTDNLHVIRTSARGRVLNNWYTKSRSDLVTDVVSKFNISDLIRQQIKLTNRGQSMHTALANVETIRNMFIEVFRKENAYAFKFEGKISYFVSYCLKNLFWNSKRKDIWKKLQATSSLKLEVEKNITLVNELESSSESDIKIGVLLQNIFDCSNIFFKHTGQNEVHGTLYDVYYLILSILCRDKLEELNEELASLGYNYNVEFVDINSYKYTINARNIGLGKIIPTNKGMSAKINNAESIIVKLLEYIRSNKLTADNIMYLMYSCFDEGKIDLEGRNSIWKSFVSKQTICNLADRESIPNYQSFDIVLKGAISVCTLMRNIQSCGKNIVQEYNPQLFRDSEIARSIMYFSDLKYLELISKLQKETCPDYGDGNLRNFPTLVKDIVGSENNGHNDIKKSRENAFQKGLLTEHRKKKSNSYTTTFSKVSSLADVITSVPREMSEDEFIVKNRENASNNLNYDYELPYAEISLNAILPRAYINLYRNIFLIENKNIANTLIAYNIGEELPDMKFDRVTVMNHIYDGMWFSDYSTNQVLVGIYNIPRQYFLYSDADGNVNASDLNQLRILNKNRKMVNSNVELDYNNTTIQECFIGELFSGISQERANNALGFNTYLGFTGTSLDLITEYAKNIDIYHSYALQANIFLREYIDLSRLQVSFMFLAKSLFLNTIDDLSNKENDNPVARNLFEEFLKCEFMHLHLQDYLEDLKIDYDECDNLVTVIPTSTSMCIETSEIDTIAFDIVFGKKDIESKHKIKLKSGVTEVDTVANEFISYLDDNETFAERFVLLHNFIDQKIKFIRYIRDAYEIIFNHLNTDINSIICVLNSTLNINNKFKEIVNSNAREFTTISSITNDKMIRFITNVNDASYIKHMDTIKTLYTYINKCTDSLNELVDYDVSTSNNVSEVFAQWGSAMKMKGNTRGVEYLGAKFTIYDESGFYTKGHSYMSAKVNGNTYYVHTTGRLLEQYKGDIKPVDIDFDNEDDVLLYKKIIEEVC